MPVNVIPLSEEEKKQFVVAESVTEPQILPGTEKIKDPLGQEQKDQQTLRCEWRLLLNKWKI